MNKIKKTTVQQDSPSAQILVHGIPTSYSLANIDKGLTTFNTGLVLAHPPRWLRPDQQRVGKKASSVVITTAGPKAKNLALLPRLSAFSATFRLECRLRFGPHTQCCNCQRYSHHTLKCTKPATCHWCSKDHSAGDHTCPTATCQTSGRLCVHSSPMCFNCDGPHEAHSTTYTKRQFRKRPGEENGEDDEVEMVGTT